MGRISRPTDLLVQKPPRGGNARRHHTEVNLLSTPASRPPFPDTLLGWHEAILDAPDGRRALLLRARGFVTMGAERAVPTSPLKGPLQYRVVESTRATGLTRARGPRTSQ